MKLGAGLVTEEAREGGMEENTSPGAQRAFHLPLRLLKDRQHLIQLALGDEQSLEEETGRRYKMKGPVLGREYVSVVYVAIPQSLIETTDISPGLLHLGGLNNILMASLSAT
ncbi:hypothetical protein EYF80_009347 [Liparis tanakae]|uniref:Uncharacterized protein n=1 Tax=Liparis tanakae TaxID=230148 RepID=A0A4Z2IT23_9TELE|nr:hypothetical protein EYF80_009347 [Liparis tanakae]